MRKKSGNRVRLVVIVGLFSTLALGSFWVREIMRRGEIESQPGAPRVEPDYYVEKFVFARMSSAGQPRYNITGGKMTHYPQNDTYEIQLPVVNTRSNPQSPMTMRAERAVIEHAHTKIHMYQDVQIDRPASAAVEHFHLDTEYLMLLPDDDVMQTDKEVRLTLGQTRLAGKGMLVNNATREFHLSNQVHGIYPPASKASAQ